MKLLSSFTVVVLLVLVAAGVAAQPQTGDTVYIKPARTSFPGGAELYCPHPDSVVQTKMDGHTMDLPVHSLWLVRRMGNDNYTFYNMRHNRYLGIAGSAKTLGAGVVLRSTVTTDAIWKLVTAADGYKFKNLYSGLFMTERIPNNRIAKGYLSQQADSGNAKNVWKFTNYVKPPSRYISFDVNLYAIGVAEATRNRIDNGDCKRIFGTIKVELYTLDANGKENELIYSNNRTGLLFSEPSYNNAPFWGRSYYQDKEPANRMLSLNYTIDTGVFRSNNFILKITTYLGTRHKDNDLATYDGLKMERPEVSSYRIYGKNSSGIRAIGHTFNLTYKATFAPGERMEIGGETVDRNIFRGDDTHKLWVKIVVAAKQL